MKLEPALHDQGQSVFLDRLSRQACG